MKYKGQRGQALIIIALAMIGLIGITGLAVDGSMAFSDRRHAQNAADTAAIAGAIAKINADPEMDVVATYAALTLAAMNRAGENGYSSDLVSNTVEVYTCDMIESSCGNPYTGGDDYVQVIITSHINTFFAGVVGIPQMHNRVQAIALAKAGGNLYGGKNIIALSPTCKQPGTFKIEGTTSVVLDSEDGSGGLFINSNNPSCGFTCSTSSGTIVGDITTAGGEIDLSSHCEESVTGTQSQSGEVWDFPVTLADLDLEIPPECNSPVGTYKNYNGNYSGYSGIQLTVLTPGKYSDFPPQKEMSEGKLYSNILMLPGVYCVDNVIKLTENDPKMLVGKDVTFFIRAGHNFSINGGIVTLDAPDSGDYAGYLMIVEPDYGSPDYASVNPPNCTINGGATNTFEGAIFAPYCNVTINGNSENIASNSQVIGYTVTLTGGGTVNFSYDADKNPILDASTGLIK